MPSTAELQCANYFGRLSKLVDQVSSVEIGQFLDCLWSAWEHKTKVMFCGNGGSAMSALHIATDLGKGVRQATGRPLKCFTSIDNMGLLTAYANDSSYADAFAEQVIDRLERGDTLIAISVSGQSENLIRAVRTAARQGVRTVALCGFDGGTLRSLCDMAVVVPSPDFQLVEDVHMAIGHMAMQYLSSRFSTTS